MTSSPLLEQLAHRAIAFHQATNISRNQMAQAIGTEAANYSAFLNGKRGLAAESVCALLKFTGMTHRQAIAAFSEPVRSSKILRLQEQGKRLKFDNSGWIAKEGSTDDPNGTTDISSTSDAQRRAVDNLLSVLAELDEMARVAALNAIQKAYPNPNGTTAPNGQRFSRRR
jgi:hypothetical protein